MSASSDTSLLTAASLLGCEKDDLKESLVSRVMQAARGGTKGTIIKSVPLLQIETYYLLIAIALGRPTVIDWVIYRLVSLYRYFNFHSVEYP